jgi:uncharacterized protein YndB with AHSA1/START domain
MTSTNRVTESRRLEAPASKVFALLTDPGHHPEFDGSGMLVSAITPGRVGAVGDVFSMQMHNDEMGEYVVDNHVVEFEPDRRIAWEPVLSDTSSAEHRADIGRTMHVRWGYELEPCGQGETLLTEFFDCSRSPEDFQAVLKGGTVWTKAISASLEKIEAALARS